ncbi:hypothetical protein ACXPWS_12860 [Mycobacterium sp. BMJ-28]
MTPTENVPTDSDIRAAILAALTDELQSWVAVKRCIPGNPARVDQVAVELFERHELTLVKVAGTPYVRAASSWDRAAAAADIERRRNRHPLLVSRCRQHVAVRAAALSDCPI